MVEQQEQLQLAFYGNRAAEAEERQLLEQLATHVNGIADVVGQLRRPPVHRRRRENPTLLRYGVGVGAQA